MTNKIKVTPQKQEMLENEGPEIPLLDLSDAAVKQLIRSAKKRGYVTHDQINALLSVEEVKSEQIEDILAKFSEMGINVVETKEAEPEEEVATMRSRRRKAKTSWSRSSNVQFRSSPGPRSPLCAPTTPWAGISARCARWNFFRARARSPLRSASRPAAGP
jgi:hypothetical protein